MFIKLLLGRRGAHRRKGQSLVLPSHLQITVVNYCRYKLAVIFTTLILSCSV
jgi:hypothetical protein